MIGINYQMSFVTFFSFFQGQSKCLSMPSSMSDRTKLAIERGLPSPSSLEFDSQPSAFSFQTSFFSFFSFSTFTFLFLAFSTGGGGGLDFLDSGRKTLLMDSKNENDFFYSLHAFNQIGRSTSSTQSRGDSTEHSSYQYQSSSDPSLSYLSIYSMYLMDDFLSSPLFPPQLLLSCFISSSLLNRQAKHSLKRAAMVSTIFPHLIKEQSTLYQSRSFLTSCLVKPLGAPFQVHLASLDVHPYSLPCGGASQPWKRNLFDLVLPSVLTLHLVFLSPLMSPSKTASGVSPPPATSHSSSITLMMSSWFLRSKCFSMQEYSWGGWSRYSSMANLMLYCLSENFFMILHTVFFIWLMHQLMEPVASITNRMSTRLWYSARSPHSSIVPRNSFLPSSAFCSPLTSSLMVLGLQIGRIFIALNCG